MPLLAKGIFLLPSDLMQKYQLSANDVFGSKKQDALRNLVEKLTNVSFLKLHLVLWISHPMTFFSYTLRKSFKPCNFFHFLKTNFLKLVFGWTFFSGVVNLLLAIGWSTISNETPLVGSILLFLVNIRVWRLQRKTSVKVDNIVKTLNQIYDWHLWQVVQLWII